MYVQSCKEKKPGKFVQLLANLAPIVVFHPQHRHRGKNKETGFGKKIPTILGD